MTLRARPDRTYISHHRRSRRFLLVEVTSPASSRTHERSPVNLAFVLDRSGSMGGQKIKLAHRAVEEGIRRLESRDRFSVVAYDDRIDVVVESTPASPEAKRNALARLSTIDARGSTNLAEGWLRGCEQVAANASTDQIDRCLLLTDGLANVGITDPAELERHAAEDREAWRHHQHLRHRRRLRRAAAERDRDERRRQLPLHRAGGPDPGLHHQRGRRDARRRSARCHAGDRDGARRARRPGRSVQGVHRRRSDRRGAR